MVNKLDFIQYQKYDITMRLVQEEDAEFILDLRTDPVLGRNLSATSSKLEDQISWIKRYKELESQGLEYYFLTIGPKGERLGTTRLSELDNECFELGSWLFKKDAPAGTAIKADIITKEIGFDLLGFDCCKFNVRKMNTKVLKYHLSYNPKKVDENELDVYFTLSKQQFNHIKERYIKIL